MTRRPKERGPHAHQPGRFGADTFGSTDAPVGAAAHPLKAAKTARQESAAPIAEPALFAEVAIDRPMRREYTYAVEARHATRVAPGVRVAIQLGGRREVAVGGGTTPTSHVPRAQLEARREGREPAALVDESQRSGSRGVARE
jgi:hypothetical protein